MAERIADGQVDDVWEDLVVSILSVNQYSLEKTYAAIDGIRSEKLASPDHLITWDSPYIEERLKAAGCYRGSFMTRLFAERLAALGRFVREQGVERFQSVIAGKDTKAIETLLLPINGIGPVVLKKFYLLRGLEK